MTSTRSGEWVKPLSMFILFPLYFLLILDSLWDIFKREQLISFNIIYLSVLIIVIIIHLMVISFRHGAITKSFSIDQPDVHLESTEKRLISEISSQFGEISVENSGLVERIFICRRPFHYIVTSRNNAKIYVDLDDKYRDIQVFLSKHVIDLSAIIDGFFIELINRPASTLQPDEH